MASSENNSGRQKQSGNFALYALLSAISIFLAFYLRNYHNPMWGFFAKSMTSPYSANMLFSGYPNESVVFYPMIKDLLSRFLSVYIIPAIFIASTVFFAIMAANCRKNAEPDNAVDNLSFDKITGWFVKHRLQTVSVILIIILFTVLRYWSLGENIFSGDEFSYLFQAKIMSHFQLSIPAPEPADSFAGDQIVSKGRFFSKYTAGFPLLLVPFVMINNPFILNPILAALAVAVMFGLSRELFDDTTALIASILLVISPFFIMNSITVLVHTGSLLFFLLFLLFYLKSVREKSILNPVAAGASIGMTMLIRPADLFFPIVFFAAISVVLLIKGGIPGETTDKQSQRKQLIKNFLLMMAGASVFIAFLLYVNYAQTGSPFKFSFQEYISEEKWGLGAMGHNHIRAIWNSTFALTRLFVWLPPLMIGLSLFSFRDKGWKPVLLMLLAVSPVIFYYFYYGIGFHEFGPRYYFLSLSALPILTARGIINLEKWLKTKRIFAPAAVITLAVMVFFTLAGTFPGILTQSTAYPVGLTYFFRDVEQKFGNSQEGVILFLQTTPHQLLSYYTRNDPYLTSKNIIVNFLDMESNEKVISKFPNKKPMLVNFNEQTQQWSYTPWYDKPYEQLPLEEKVRICITSAFNYTFAVRDFKKSIKQIDKGLEVAPQDFRLYNAKGILQKADNDFRGAEASWITSSKLNPSDIQTVYDLALLQTQIGKKTEAKANFEKCIRSSTDPRMQNMARMWLESINKGER